MGPTGILRVLADDYLKYRNVKYKIAWYQDIVPNNLNHLKQGKIDIALIAESAQVNQAIKEGSVTNFAPIFNDHFLIVGPRENLANLSNNDSAEQAFAKIAKLGKKISVETFLSRNDDSFSNIKEKQIWNMIGLTPWQSGDRWYVKFMLFQKTPYCILMKNHFIQ